MSLTSHKSLPVLCNCKKTTTLSFSLDHLRAKRLVTESESSRSCLNRQRFLYHIYSILNSCREDFKSGTVTLKS